jgi:hypothetical protein
VRYDVQRLAGTLDLWGCVWTPEEQVSFETALVRAMTDEQPHATRLDAWAACSLIATDRLAAAATWLAGQGVFDGDELRAVEDAIAPLRRAMTAAEHLRRALTVVEALLRREAEGTISPADHAALAFVDLRDLVDVALTTPDARVYAAAEEAVARRGRYQRARAANVLGFKVRRPDQRVSHPPEIGERERRVA